MAERKADEVRTGWCGQCGDKTDQKPLGDETAQCLTCGTVRAGDKQPKRTTR